MDVKAGDHLVVRGHTVARPDRTAEVLNVLGADGGPPYRAAGPRTGTKDFSSRARTRWSSTRPRAARNARSSPGAIPVTVSGFR